MKFYKFIYITLVGCLLSGCEKILDKKDLGKIGEADNVWNDLDLATAYVNRIHAQCLPEWNTSNAGISDETAGGGSYMYGQLTENSVDYWPYDHIRRINILLAEIDQGTLEDADKQWLKGQALFFRAWEYFEMVKLYGGVPLILEPQQLTDDLLVKRSSTSECMQQIIADLDLAIEYLPAVSQGSAENNGRVHKGTALAVKGRILLYYASPQFDPDQDATDRWQAAYDANFEAKAFLESMGFGLYPSFSELWFEEMNKESVFVRRYQYSPSDPASYNNWAAATRPLDVSQGSTGGNRPTWDIVQAFPMKDGKAIDDLASDYAYDPDYFWLNRDPRFNQTIVYNGSLWELGMSARQSGRIQWTYIGSEQNSPTPSGFYTRKAIDENQSAIQAFNSSTDWIELRFAEVLLNLAEAANEIGKIEEAYTEITALRARAGIESGTDSRYGLADGMNIAQMRDAIMLERKIEFAFENKRYWDLRRRRLFEDELNGTRRYGLTITLKVPTDQWNAVRNSMTSQELISHLNTNYTDYFESAPKLLDTQFDINWKPEYYFFAIPAEHLQLNSNLEQTSGWPGGTFNPLL
ncbi:RagB/SusD family nutrient uptake outer membrane protein [Parapedobacter soli]|uniref:RagB/SusD family nutrient uptake outer membrane protein n=1 Tax=Parapedobacter soli TaxID=416955 RepID=UPI0021C5CE20|nr:RagB/SusD family nutrient uptake outer membrane protein [Parapedobacter soli]